VAAVTQLRTLAMPFPKRVIHENPSGGGSYVAHHLYTQRLLLHLGAYSFERVEVLRGHVDAISPNPQGNSKRAKEGRPALENAVVGVIARLTVTIDGERVAIEEAGDCEDPHNWPHDGARLKDAMSDALKRCCARIGLGTHLYARSPDEFVLFDALTKQEEGADSESPGSGSTSSGDTAAPAAGETDEDPGRPFE